MRVSELVAETGIPLATIKYYLREGLLMPGEATSATRAEYGSEHVHRLTLVKALSGLGLPIPRIRLILRLIDEPSSSLFESLGAAVGALPPYADDSDHDPHADYPRAQAAIEKLGQVYRPDFVAVSQLERALAAAEDVGIPMTDQRLQAYGEHVRGIAATDLAEMPQSAQAAIEYAVLGTAIYEPVISAMRRLAHQDLAEKMFDQTKGDSDDR